MIFWSSVFLFLLAANTPSNVRISHIRLTSLRVSWTYYSSWPPVTGFHISYYQQDGTHTGSVTAGRNNNNVAISGLITGSTYLIRVVANSSTLPSDPSSTRFTLCMFFISYVVDSLMINIAATNFSEHFPDFLSLLYRGRKPCHSHLLHLPTKWSKWYSRLPVGRSWSKWLHHQ